MTPVPPRSTGHKCRILIHEAIDVGAKARLVHRRDAAERLQRDCRGDEPAAMEWPQLADGRAVARDDERFAAVQISHDPPAVVAQLALADLPGHAGERSTGATHAQAQTAQHVGI